MDAALTADKIPHLFDDYGAGGHAWFYWQRDLKESLPDIMQTFAHPPAAPRTWDYKSIDPAYSVWGWSVKIDRPALEFSELKRVNRVRLRTERIGHRARSRPARSTSRARSTSSTTRARPAPAGAACTPTRTGACT